MEGVVVAGGGGGGGLGTKPHPIAVCKLTVATWNQTH